MINARILLLALIICPFYLSAQTHDTESLLRLDTNTQSAPQTVYTTGYESPDFKSHSPRRDWARLGITTGMYFGTTALAFGILWVAPESFSNWDKDKIRQEGFFAKYKKNITSGPVWDKDDFFINYVTHPWSGGVYYMTARTNHFSIAESFIYSALMSTFFWEYGIESVAEIPSWQDLISTPTVGAILGEGFFYAKKAIQRNDNRILHSRILGESAMFLIDPFNQILDWCGYRKASIYANFAPVGINPNGSAVWGISLNASF